MGADFGEDLSGDHQANVFVDDWNKFSGVGLFEDMGAHTCFDEYLKTFA